MNIALPTIIITNFPPSPNISSCADLGVGCFEASVKISFGWDVYLPGKEVSDPNCQQLQGNHLFRQKSPAEKLDGGALLLAQTIGVGKRLTNGEWVDAALGPESFRLHVELNQQVFNDISLGGIKTWVSQSLKSAEFCLRHFPHILPPFYSSFQHFSIAEQGEQTPLVPHVFPLHIFF